MYQKVQNMCTCMYMYMHVYYYHLFMMFNSWLVLCTSIAVEVFTHEIYNQNLYAKPFVTSIQVTVRD